MLDAGGIGSITTCLSQAALAGLASFQSTITGATYIINRPGKSVCRNGPGAGSAFTPCGSSMKSAVCKARRYYKRRYARLSIARCGCVNLTADRMKRSFTLHPHSWQRFAISCAIYIAALIYQRFSFCGGSLTGATQSGDSCPGAGSRRGSWRTNASGTSQRQCRSGADDAGAVIPGTIRRGAARFAGAGPPSTGLSAGIYRRFQ